LEKSFPGKEELSRFGANERVVISKTKSHGQEEEQK